LEQEVSPILPKVPAGQSESQLVDPAEEEVPAAQGWQILLPSSYLPATQSLQDAAPLLETRPPGQIVHVADAIVEYVPGSQ
jgi:hypothetical protein